MDTKLANSIADNFLKHSNNNTIRAKVLIDKYIHHMKSIHPKKTVEEIIIESNKKLKGYTEQKGRTTTNEDESPIPGSIIFMKFSYIQPILD
jgi:hypothetical protein